MVHWRWETGTMSEKHSVEIRCSACGQDSLLLREPVYDGFARTGETLKCASCGHVYDSEADVPFRHASTTRVFTEADRSHTPEVFASGEADRLCRHCVQYVVNPFMQWCGLHRKEVEATDSCNRFEPRPPAEEDAEPDDPGPSLL